MNNELGAHTLKKEKRQVNKKIAIEDIGMV